MGTPSKDLVCEVRGLLGLLLGFPNKLNVRQATDFVVPIGGKLQLSASIVNSPPEQGSPPPIPPSCFHPDELPPPFA